jgi:acyl-CoA synthetase (AMP-forming)/AMP-acid ligase II
VVDVSEDSHIGPRLAADMCTPCPRACLEPFDEFLEARKALQAHREHVLVALAHPAVHEAAVIAVPPDRWSERPLARVVLESGESLTRDDLAEFLESRIPRWWIPDAIEVVDEIPKTSVGKFSKLRLREQLSDYRPT